MKATKGNIHRFVKLQLATKPEWALKALVRIFKENQTPSEQSSQTTVEDIWGLLFHSVQPVHGGAQLSILIIND